MGAPRVVKEAASYADPDELVAWLCDLEMRYRLFEQQIGGVAFWHLVRMAVYCRLAMSVGLMTPARLAGYKPVPGAMRQTASGRRGDLLRGRIDSLVVPAQTRFQGPRGRVEPLTDRLLRELRTDHARILELLPIDPRECDYAGHTDVVSASALQGPITSLAAAIARRQGWGARGRRDAATVSLLDGPVHAELQKRGYRGPEPAALALSAASSYRAARAIYGLLMRRWSPRRVYLTVAYGKEAIVDAARAVGAAVIELQHGLVRRHHVGYHFPYGVHDLGRPDVLALFGPYWRDNVALAPRVVPTVVGSPRAATRSSTKREGVLVLSGQPFEGSEVVRYVRALAAAHPSRCIVVRTHPNQRADYDVALSDVPNVRLDGGDGPVEDALGAVTHVVSGCSTALFEGLSLGCRALLVDSGHSRWILAALGVDAVKVVSSPEDAARALDQAPAPPPMDRFLGPPLFPILPCLEAALAAGRAPECAG